MNGEHLGPRRSALQIGLGAIVVFVGVGAVIGAAAITLKHYPAVTVTSGQPGNDRSSAVVAVLTPIVAAIAGIVGLYFGVSATGSARGQQAQASSQVAQSLSETAKTATRSAETVSELAESAKLLAQNAARIGAGPGSPVIPDTRTPTSTGESAAGQRREARSAQPAGERAAPESGARPAADTPPAAGDTQPAGYRPSGAAGDPQSSQPAAGGGLESAEDKDE